MGNGSLRVFYSLFTSRFSNETIAIAYLLSSLFNVTFFLQMTIMPYLAKHIGMTVMELGFAQMFGGMLQIVGSLINGFISTQYGVQWSLMLCYFSAITSELLSFIATNRAMIYISLVPHTFMNGEQCYMTLFSALTSPGKERTEAFAGIGMTFGIGFLLSTVISVPVIKFFGERMVLIIAALLSVLQMTLFSRYIAMDLSKFKNNSDSEHEGQRTQKFDFESVTRIAKKPQVVTMLISKSAVAIPTMLTFSIIQIHFINSFGISPSTNSLIQGYFGLVIMFANGIGTPKLRKCYTEEELFTLGTVFLAIVNTAMIGATRLWTILLLLIFFCLGMTITVTAADSMITSAVHKEEEGVIVGAITSVNALTRAIAPGIAGYLLEKYGFPVFGIIGGILSFLVTLSRFTF